MMKRKRDVMPAPPGFVSVTSFTLTKRNDVEIQNDIKPEPIGKLQKSLKQRPWILHDQLINKKPDRTHQTTNVSFENTLPKGVIRGCSMCNNCQKVTSSWRQEESCRPVLEYAPAFHPTEVEFKDVLEYIAKIRPKAEEYGICRIIPPDSWKPPSLLNGNKWESSRFSTHIHQIDELKDLHSKRKLHEMIEQAEGKNGSDGFEFESGPEFTLRGFKAYAAHFKGQYFKKKDIFTDYRTRPWENVEGEYWRIVQNPTEQIQVLSGHNLDTKVIGSGFPLPLPSSLDTHEDQNQSEYAKSPWNLNNTSKLPGSLLAFDYDNSTLSTPRLDIGMCFSSLCWKVEEHNLYTISYMHQGASRTWYGIPSKYRQNFESLLKKTFPELSGKPELFHKLVTQLSPSTLKSEGIPVYRCLQHPKQFVIIFPGAFYSGFDSGFSVSEKVNLAPVDWLPYGQLSVEIYSELHRKTLISYDKVLIEGARDAIKTRMPGDSNACGKDGWFTRALKSLVKREGFKRELLCNASQSRTMEEGFSCLVKQECIVCFSDLYLSATGCACSPEKYSCLEHSKQLCTCPWSSRLFFFRNDIRDLNRIIEALEGK
ncbi:putative lysine-specific demethylase JMJ16 [Lactuca sativa]|uniref:JmjC domain-containing protein n=1 Tax=Lactuca sativa TaxID=4236 RepID=A0A9R1WX19_LACSA|nr:putative lysine-specific demethylase JMJ16 [Lactuca sativa]KAJ0192205.1 hypothetical protein LSAT_V11C800425530 [Lactuca sativa]